MTEGVVTDIDISLALPEQKEDNPLIWFGLIIYQIISILIIEC